MGGADRADERGSDVPDGRAPKGDVYRGALAARYHRSRSADPKWDQEQASLAQLLRSIPQGVTVLDVPFGTGRFLPEYGERGLRVTGLDSSEDMLAAAREVIAELGADPGAVDMRIGDALAMPFDDASFDVVVCVRFLASVVALVDAPVVLAEVARLARTFAIVQFRVPPSDDALPATKAPDERMEHQCGRADQDLLLARAGLGVVDEVWDRDEDGGGLRLVLCRRDGSVAPARTLPESWGLR